jgi:3-methyladenine DNA glycosylase AlkD
MMGEPVALTAEAVLARLRDEAEPANVEGMARFGISSEGTLGVSVPTLRTLAGDIKRETGRDAGGREARHELAADLWATAVHEARILAALVDVPALVSAQQMDEWASQIDSWDICDQVCSNLFDKTPYAYEKAYRWAEEDPEFVKRAGFVLMAVLAVHDKQADDARFLEMLPVIEKHAGDERNFVKKAVNWALRQIGKRSATLHGPATRLAERLASSEDRTKRWVGTDAYRELNAQKTLDRLGIAPSR